MTAAALALILVAAAAQRTLAGTWAIKDALAAPVTYDAADCGTDFAVRYHADGRFEGYEEAGRWTLRGDLLTEVVDRALDDRGEMVAVPTERRTFRLRWLSPNHINARIGRETSGMLRCPPAP